MQKKANESIKISSGLSFTNYCHIYLRAVNRNDNFGNPAQAGPMFLGYFCAVLIC